MYNSSKNLNYLSLERSFEVTRGHQPSFANNYWSKSDRDVGLVSGRSSRPGESTDIPRPRSCDDPFRSSRDLGRTWPEVKLWPLPFNVILYMVRRALTRQAWWHQNRCSTFKIKDFIVENLENLGILTPGQGRRHGFLSGGRIVGRVANLLQNNTKIEKTPDFGHFILESGGSTDPIFKSAGVRTPRTPSPPPTPPPVGDAPAPGDLNFDLSQKKWPK